MDEKLLADGEAAALEVGIPDLHPELHKLIGRLQFRSSYGQNALKHSMEVAWLATTWRRSSAPTPRWPSAPVWSTTSARRWTARWTAPTSSSVVSCCRKYGETDEVIHAMECHHGDYDPHSVEAVLVTAADALSAARPGARREILENYIKRLEKLESMATDFKGVEKAYAIQAGRELRIVVESEHRFRTRTRSGSPAMWPRRSRPSSPIPGQIKVTVIRETRAVEYAR